MAMHEAGLIKPFDAQVVETTVSQRWFRWKRAFEFFLQAIKKR
jgi:EAL domain-containing protein (putative c-di-GMP-specific phosphodiesterase class I)